MTKKKARKSSIAPKKGGNSVGNFSTRFSLHSFIRRVDKLTDDQKHAIEKMGFGNLLRIPCQMLCKSLLAELMERWSCEKRAFMLLPGEIPITLMDVALILGLRVKGDPVILRREEPFSDLEREYGAAVWNRKITVATIEERLDSLDGVANEDFIRSFLLFTFGTLLFPNANAKVDSRYLSILQKLDKISHFAWGAAVLEDMVNWLGKRKETNVQYVGGCLIFLQIWSYKHIDIGRPNLVDFPVMFPRACRWGNSRSHQRRWFSEKFQELEMNRIIWKLQLTSEESKLDMIEELLEEQCDNEDLPAWRNNVMTDKEVIRYRLQIMDQWIAEMANESDMDTVKDDVSLEDFGKKLGIVQNIPMEPINNVNILSTSHNISDVQQEQIEHPRKSLESSTLIISSDEDNVDNVEARYQLLHKQTQKLEGEINHLKKENKVLKDQLLLKSTFEEQNRKLRKEMGHLREENKDFNNLLARLERHLCDVNVNGVEHCLESIVKGGFGNEGTGLPSSRQQDNDISALI